MIQKSISSESTPSYLRNSSLDRPEWNDCNDRQIIFAIVRQLVRAQFELADEELTNRLWQDVLERGIEVQRVLDLMYKCSSYDDKEMMELDFAYE